ncbi:MAG TPA: FAD-binding oxidoreductase [Nocardioides sp.]|uniref:FAD-binding oxidoreductase n=1 Tax=Nocardioides sp. TaxID=35761 RepID=UPI002D7F993F|nr:FAD-binding oxidoreductase [Nocardioides sp.]HET6651837.1 FAD-binding oxidoreductase [Nocardioides sp.]
MTEQMHWARWGDPAEAHPLSEEARGLVELAFGPAAEHPTTPLSDVRLPAPRLPEDLLAGLRDLVGDHQVRVDHEARVRHTRGKSTPDLLRMRHGDADDAPDAVVLPAGHDEVAAVVSWCSEHRVALVPFGGGTSVVGGLVARRDGYAGVLALDLRRLDRLVAVDRVSGTAVLEAGLLGPRAEALLAEHRLTLGPFPQSFEYASIGGFAATRSSGQASSGYGRFDQLVVALRVATPVGDLELGSAPANAAGPDLRELVLGSEGAFGVITAVTVRVRPAPETAVYETWRFASFPEGVAALRDLAQSGDAPTVLRLSDENETALNLAKPDEIGAGGEGGCLVVTGFEGTAEAVEARRRVVATRLEKRGGRSLGADDGAGWAAGRFKGPYLRDAMLDIGVLVETLETATFWSNLPRLYDEMSAALTAALTPASANGGGGPIVLCHISHVYETGASLYFTVAARQVGDGLEQWAAAKAAASDAMIAAGATITHHHAVGRDHRPWLAQEIGPVGVEILRAVKDRLDPNGVLNPGVLVP